MNENNKINIAVIGAGPGGLATAYELQKTGYYNVKVFEASAQVGGRCSTRVKDGMAFDRGANFFVAKYRNTAEYCKELGLEASWQPTSRRGEHFTTRDGRLCLLSMTSIWSLFKFDALSWKSRVKLLWLFYNARRKYHGLNFFDLASLPPHLNSTNAYDYIKENVGEDAADYIVDAFTSMYQFHSAKQMSSAAMFALVNMIASDTGGFTRYHTANGQMSEIPEAMAKRLDVQTSSPISDVFADKELVYVKLDDNILKFDKVVIATTADVAKKIYKNPSDEQRRFLDSVHYAPTINVSFKVDTELLDGIACVAVPFNESQLICEYTNESLKGISQGDKTLINVGLHEEAAKGLLDKEENYIYNLVSLELSRICPPLHNMSRHLQRHDMEKWPKAMPKFSREFVDSARKFWTEGQGENGVYFAGDMTGCPWVEGAFTSGKKVAKLIHMYGLNQYLEKKLDIREYNEIFPEIPVHKTI